MKKYISLSLAVIAITISEAVKKNTAPEGQPEKIEEVEVAKDLCFGIGTIVELPENNERVQDLIDKKMIRELTAEELKKMEPETKKGK
jgi:hypothetical protein